MKETGEFAPSRLKVLALTSHKALGKALEIMLKAIGFGEVSIALPVDVCKKAAEFNPDFILFTPEYLTCSMQKKLEIGCPCKPKKWCSNALVVVMHKHQTVDNVLMSKEMGFDGIIFADSSEEKLLHYLKKVYLHYQVI